MKLGECKIDLNSDTPFFDIFKCPKFKNILEEITFKLGNGINTDSLSKAVQLFIEREHPDLLDNNFRGIKFVPEYFFSKTPDIVETDEKKWTPDQKKSLECRSGTLKGPH